MSEEAYHGLAGEYVKQIEPHSEADPVALLVQFLAAFGNIIGISAHFTVEEDRHGMRLFAVLVGETAKGRKGTSLGHIKARMGEIDPTWRVRTGLSSGEGLIWQVRDPIERIKPVREKDRTVRYEKIRIDDGIEDKRLLVVEPEFAAILRVLQREGNTLSPLIRLAWDGEVLEALTKNSPAASHGAHISIIGHVTADELRRYLDRTEMGNGFANRFIWVCVRRAKILPEGGQVPVEELEPISIRLRGAIEFGMTAGQIRKDEETRRIWAEVYSELSEGKPGMYGAITARGEAQVMRISAIYALLDKSPVIQPQHLKAALAVWEYALASVRHVFSDATGDPVADQILAAIRSNETGVTRTEIYDLFMRHQSRDRIDQIIANFQIAKKIRVEKKSTAGRPIQRIFAV